MKLPDVNICLALTLSKHSHHAAASSWLQSEEQHLCFCPATQEGLVRLLTTAEVLARYGNPPLTNREAWRVYDQFMEDDRIAFFNEPEGLEETWKAFALRESSSPKLWMDAYLAAFALTSGCQMVTTDKAFSQFKGVKTLVLKSKVP